MFAILLAFTISTQAADDFRGWSSTIAEGPTDKSYFPYMSADCNGSNCSEMRIFTNHPQDCEIDPNSIHDGESFPCGSAPVLAPMPVNPMPISGYTLNFASDSAYTHAKWDQNMNVYTVALWVKPNELGQNTFEAFFNTYHNSSKGFQLDQNGKNKYRIHGKEGTHAFADMTLEWAHVAVRADGKKTKIYFNGEKVFQKDWVNKHWDQIELGRNRNKGAPGDFNLEDVTVWGRALSQDEIKSVMNGNIDVTDTDLLVYWDMNEGEGDMILDRSGNHHNADVIKATWLPEELEKSEAPGAPVALCPPNYSLNFEDKNYYTHLDWDVNMSEYTVALWVKPNRLGQHKWDGFFNTFRNSSKGFQLDSDGNDNYRLLGKEGEWSFAPMTLQWAHIAVTASGGKTKIFFNGEKVFQEDKVNSTWDQIELGRNRNKDRPGDYKVDDALVYGRALTEAEIKSVMIGDIDGSDADLYVWYDMNEGEGKTLTDRSGNNKNSVVTGATFDLDGALACVPKPAAPEIALAPGAPAPATEGSAVCPPGEWMVGFEC